VVRVEQHERPHAIGVEQRPVDPRRAGGVVGDKNRVLQPELVDHGLDLVELVPRGRTVRNGIVGFAPAQEIEGHDPTGRDEVWYQPIVQVQVVGKPVH